MSTLFKLCELRQILKCFACVNARTFLDEGGITEYVDKRKIFIEN